MAQQGHKALVLAQYPDAACRMYGGPGVAIRFEVRRGTARLLGTGASAAAAWHDALRAITKVKRK